MTTDSEAKPTLNGGSYLESSVIWLIGILLLGASVMKFESIYALFIAVIFITVGAYWIGKLQKP